MSILETTSRIEPARLDDLPAAIADTVAALTATATTLGRALHPLTAANLAGLVRIANTHYSNLIEGHNTRPRDIERALAGHLDETDEGRRNLQLEAAAHVRLQAEIDRQAAAGTLPEPASPDFIRWLHREFYRDAPLPMLAVRGVGHHTVRMEPGIFRSHPDQDNVVGRHIPPSSHRVDDFMTYFAHRYRFKGLGLASRIVAIPAAHHRFNYIHPIPDGNGRVSRLMSHAMCLEAGLGAHGLWSISRGLARGLDPGPGGRLEYRRMMDHADSARQGDRDGRGNLSMQALHEFTDWYLKGCLDQVTFMSTLFELDRLAGRLKTHIARDTTLKLEAGRLIDELLVRGEVERGAVGRITGLPDRSARRVLADMAREGIVGSATPRGPVSLRFPMVALDTLFPRLFG